MLLRVIAYFVPFAINFLNGGFFFIAAHRFAEAHCSGMVVGSAVTAWGIAYCLVTMLTGKLSNSSNALKFIVAGGLLLTLTSAGFIIFFNYLYCQFLFLVLAGCGAALFCTPFQLLAKSIESGEKSAGTVSATAFYTMTWSVGFASGPLAFARLEPRTGFVITLLLALAVTVSALLIKFLRRNPPSAVSDAPAANQESQLPFFSEKTFSKLAILGWIVGGLGTITICQIRAMWPKLGEEMGFSRDHIAYVLALVSYTQALTALLLCRSRCWMWKRIPALLMSVCGIIALLLFAFAADLKIFYFSAILYGIYSGLLYFYLVYHSLAHPTRNSFFVAGNEVIVGITSMIFPLFGGLLADITDYTGSAFIFAAAMTACALTAQLIMLMPSKLQ